MRHEDEAVYYFGNTEFATQIKKGSLCSVKRTGDCLDTQYANTRIGFGMVRLAYRDQNGILQEFCPGEADNFQECPPDKKRGTLIYQGSSSDGSVEIVLRYLLRGKTLEEEVSIRNLTEGMITLTDLGIVQACHSDFRWGEDASCNVIGHHYVGGNGSHSAYYRVDGNGPCLVFAPLDGTAVCWYDRSPHFEEKTPWLMKDEEEQGKGLTMLYPFACGREARAKEKGARPRLSQQPQVLEGKEKAVFSFQYFWADHFLHAGKALKEHGLIPVSCVPGYTAPVGTEILVSLDGIYEDLSVSVPEKEGFAVRMRAEGGRQIWKLVFTTPGEHTAVVRYDGQRWMHLYYFATEPITAMLEKRAAFITDKQERDPSRWYHGLFCEWNNETGVRLSPDNYDRIGGWRIYEVSCDDPGLSKPAFLSTKQMVSPVQEQVSALDDYIEYFVWGGLQRTEEESYSYGIYGIPDWKQLRESDKEGTRGKLHIWRIYDYPHIALLYYNMYRVARDYPEIQTRLPKETYLLRAYRTAAAMFTIPEELDGWSAYKTGLYNERVIPWIIDGLKECGKSAEAYRLETFWTRKARYFVTECKDVFGSEYPFDTTGFESTFYLAEEGLSHASFRKSDSPFDDSVPYEKAVAFMEKQHLCNLACRGILEPGYFWYGSDYRGNNAHYLLSYMSQMGGCSILEHALYYEDDPYETLRIGYGSLLSSYALMNTGTPESNYGYWFPGKEHDGAAGGGFEPLMEGETWLDQPHHGGSWYYSCEIDLGFCGGVRGASVIVAEDPLFGWIVYGGRFLGTAGETGEPIAEGRQRIRCEDGVGRRFHWLSGTKRFHAVLEEGRFDGDCMAVIDAKEHAMTLFMDHSRCGTSRRLKLKADGMGDFTVYGKEDTACEEITVILKPQETEVTIVFEKDFE